MKSPKVGFVSLGCPKALVDSERILTQLKTEGVASDYDGADLVVVNTCGFIESAVQESLDAIGEAMSANGRVIVTGCLGKDEDKIRQMHPNVLKVTGAAAYEEVMDAAHIAALMAVWLAQQRVGRVVEGAPEDAPHVHEAAGELLHREAVVRQVGVDRPDSPQARLTNASRSSGPGWHHNQKFALARIQTPRP